MILDFFRTMALSIKRFFTRDSVIVEASVAYDRIEVCKECVYLTGTNIINYKCKLCKCYLNYKSKFSASECPAGFWAKWLAVTRWNSYYLVVK